MKFCPYCGAQLKHSASECPGCGKRIGQPDEPSGNKPGMANLDAYGRTIPTWLFVAVVLVAVLALVLVFVNAG